MATYPKMIHRMIMFIMWLTMIYKNHKKFWMASCVVTGHQVTALRWRTESKTGDYAHTGEPRGDMEPARAGCTNGTGGGHSDRPHIICTSTETGNQDGGVAHRAAIHGERNGYGVSGVML